MLAFDTGAGGHWKEKGLSVAGRPDREVEEGPAGPAAGRAAVKCWAKAGDERGLAVVSSGPRPRFDEGMPLRAGARKGPDLVRDREVVDWGETGTLQALAALEAAVDFGVRLADRKVT